MVELLAVMSEALNTTFALFARKLILSGQVVAVICMVGWRLDSKLGIQLWPHPSRGLALLSDSVAAGSTIAVVLPHLSPEGDAADTEAPADFIRRVALEHLPDDIQLHGLQR